MKWIKIIIKISLEVFLICLFLRQIYWFLDQLILRIRTIKKTCQLKLKEAVMSMSWKLLIKQRIIVFALIKSKFKVSSAFFNTSSYSIYIVSYSFVYHSRRCIYKTLLKRSSKFIRCIGVYNKPPPLNNLRKKSGERAGKRMDP